MAALDAPPPALSPALLAGMSDRTLIGLIAAGSDDAVAALDARFRPRMLRVARGFSAGGSDAEDAVQEAMMRAVRALRGGSRPEAVGPWLQRIARNCALDLSASRRRHPVVELADHQHPIAEGAEAILERRERVAGLVADVVDLPQTQRSALVLRELEGRSYADIATELDVTVPAVKSLLVRARQGLKRSRVAAFFPFGLLHRWTERLASTIEPLTATATPKVACMAVVVAGALPVVSGGTTQPPPRHATTQPVHTAIAAKRTATRVTAARIAATAPVDLSTDCADGTIDGHFSRTQLLAALRHLNTTSHEYSDCHDALVQALLRRSA